MKTLHQIKQLLHSKVNASRNLKAQRGLSVTELMIYIAIVGIMLGSIFSMLSTDKSRATSLNTTMSNMASSMQRAKADMGCDRKVPGAL